MVMNKLSTSVKSAAAAAVLIAMASASATAGETTTQTGFAAGDTTTPTVFTAVAQLPVTALSTSEMAETRGGLRNRLPVYEMEPVFVLGGADRQCRSTGLYVIC
jgi:hypothetical protein